jgi:hypothetical protein
MNVTAFAQRAEAMIAERDAEIARLQMLYDACKIALGELAADNKRLREEIELASK